jgi:Na+-translocating ferredoxin:NAD+ oxidoreductase RnfD subunit
MSSLALELRGARYPIVLPSVRDPRLHLAAVIVSLQLLGQAGFGFRLSIAQILVSVGTCAVLEIVIVGLRQGVLMWPASALLTGNGVAFVLRVPDTRHGDWWSTRGWWIFAGTAAVSLLSKHVLRVRGSHVFNPSNVGLVLCFLVLGSGRAEPLDFWWGPMSTWLVAALVIIVLGGFAILSRLRLLEIAVSFWLSFAAALAVLAATGHSMTARWHLGPIAGFDFWKTLVTSPEILVFLFFMITDPRTVPRGRRQRIAYGSAIGLLAAVLVAPAQTEYWSKVAVLAALAVVCGARVIPLRPTLSVRMLAVGLAAYVGLLAFAGIPARPVSAPAQSGYAAALPPITILPSKGVDSKPDARLASQIARDLMAALARKHVRVTRIFLWLEVGPQGGSSIPVVRLQPDGRTLNLALVHGRYVVTAAAARRQAAEIMRLSARGGDRNRYRRDAA